MVSILILGGTGETGSWFARYFKEKGFDVAVWGPSGKVEVAERLGVRYAQDMMREVEKSDIVLVSVLIEKTVEVIREVAPHMHPGSLIMDVTSIKSGPVKAMKTYAPKGVEVLGTHPMFGPTMAALRGQTIILTPVEGKTGKWLPIMQSLFESDGAHVEILDAEEHDEIMAVVQALTHFAYIGIGAALRTLDFDVERSRRFMSPVYEIMIDFVGRILDQNPELYASIQKNPKAAVGSPDLCGRVHAALRKGRCGGSGGLQADHGGGGRALRGNARGAGEVGQGDQRPDRGERKKLTLTGK